MRVTKKKIFKLGLFAAVLGMASMPVQAANWLMLQGTEKAGSAPRAKLWGFIQAQYQDDGSSANAGNAYIPPKLIGPNLTAQSQFNINRARIGVRGTGLPLDSKVNYFLLLELGNNAITNANNGATNITDASITLNHIEGARIRLGLFKTPGFEEGLQAIHVFDWINFTTVGNQLMLERLPNRTFGTDVTPQTLPAMTDLNTFNQPVGAFRDVGVQVFDTFKDGNWEHSYAVMIGNGNGLNFGDNDDNKDTYLYWSSEQVYGGKGPFREGLKFFAWSQSGKRTFDGDNDSAYEEYDRDRSGFGVKYKKKPWRFSAEYLSGEGMIFVGPQNQSFDINAPGGAGSGLNGEASGYYLEAGYYIPGTKWDVGIRYDEYNRLEGDTLEMKFETITLGAQYQFNKKTRLTINYADRDFNAVNFGPGAGPNANLDGVAERISVQLTHIF